MTEEKKEELIAAIKDSKAAIIFTISNDMISSVNASMPVIYANEMVSIMESAVFAIKSELSKQQSEHHQGDEPLINTL